jgi:hypothetical protein
LDERGAVAADDADRWIRQGHVHHMEFSLRPVLAADELTRLQVHLGKIAIFQRVIDLLAAHFLHEMLFYQ